MGRQSFGLKPSTSSPRRPFGVDPEFMVRGHRALHGRDRVRNQRRDLPSGAAIAVRGKTFGRVQDVAGQLQLEDLALRSVVSRKSRIWRTRRAGLPARDQVVCRRRSFPGPPLARRRLLRGRLLFTSSPLPAGDHLFFLRSTSQGHHAGPASHRQRRLTEVSGGRPSSPAGAPRVALPRAWPALWRCRGWRAPVPM